MYPYVGEAANKTNVETQTVCVCVCPHPSFSGSMRTSSLSSPPAPDPGAPRLGVDVVTRGTDWEAGSGVSIEKVSIETVSEKTVTKWMRGNTFSTGNFGKKYQ